MKKEVFSCIRCGNCCHGVGGIYLTQEEIQRLSNHFSISYGEFIKEYCEYVQGKIRLRTKDSGVCIFYEDGVGCIIHEIKPYICSLWPFFPANIKDEQSFFVAKLSCPGINPEITHKEFVKFWQETNDK
jgi:Fe-S-cluster containining protein